MPDGTSLHDCTVFGLGCPTSFRGADTLCPLMAAYSEGQLNKFKHLMKVAARFLFTGDLIERVQQAEGADLDDDSFPEHKKKRRRSKVIISFF